MKLIRSLTWKNMKNARARTLVTLLGVILSAAMFTAVTTMGVSFRDYMVNAEIASSGDWFVRYDYGSMEELSRLREDEDVTALGTLNALGYTRFQIETDSRTVDDTLILAAGDRNFYDMIPVKLLEGRLPETGSELVITGNVQEYLQLMGQPAQVGDQLSLTVEPDYADTDLPLPVGEAAFQRTFTIVGVTEYFTYFDDSDLNLSSLLTFDDGSREGLWGRFFVKTEPGAAYELVERDYGPAKQLNSNLLTLYGTTKYSSINSMIFSFGAVLIAIIMVGSVSLIYNAFSISVSERTRQFGLLSSVGATRRQLRRCVFTEALMLSAAGIPLGIFGGYGGIAVTLHLTHDLVDDLLSSAAETGMELQAVPSVPAFVLAGLVALVTVLISAWIPARRATLIAPIEAIRQTREYKVPKNGIRAGKLSGKLFGLPAALARKYYTVNKRKYRATVISLTISMVLFVATGTFVQQLNATAVEETNLENYDLSVYVESEGQVSALRGRPEVKASALVRQVWRRGLVEESELSEAYRQAWQEQNERHGSADEAPNLDNVDVVYLEDTVLESYLLAQGLDPAPYLSGELTLVAPAQLTLYQFDEDGRATDRRRLTIPVLAENVEELTLYPGYIPDGVIERLGGSISDEGVTMKDGRPVYQMRGTEEDVRYDAELRLTPNGSGWGFHLVDPDTGMAETEPTDVVPVAQTSVKLGDTIRELPMGVGRANGFGMVRVILPLSAAAKDGELPMLRVSVSDYDSFRACLEGEGYAYEDLLAGQLQYRDYITMIRIFSYGFITLISLICICNVFNTISTNIALRRKDFGMLRSVGMKDREIDRMMAFECLQYGWKALLYGLPLSLLVSLGISRLISLVDYKLPVQSIAVAAGGIFITVFITMFYAVSKLKKENTIEAIRAQD